MPTKKRITVPGAFAHVMARAIDGMPLFQDDTDRQFFLDLLSRGITKSYR